MEGKTVVLAMGMLLTGTLNTLATKYQDLVVVGHDSHGHPRYFQHPVVQSAMMFLGELMCLIPYTASFLAQRWVEDPDTARAGGIQERRRSAHSIKALLAFSIPAACDACGSTLLNIGLFFTYASAFQMLRGSLVFFCGIFTIIILKRRLHVHHWLGMTLIVAGAALVGLASLITDEWAQFSLQLYSTVPRHLLFMGRRGLKTAPGNDTLWVDSVYESNHGSPHMNPNLVDGVVSSSQVTSWLAKSSSTASAPLLGNALVIAAQIAAAAQFIIEEKFLTQYRVPALLAVGLEGFWGLLICLTIGPWLARVDLFHGRPFDNFSTALHEIAVSPMLLWSTVASIVSIAFFNSFGVRVTKRLSGAARAAIDACRTLFIWVIALGLGWEPLSPPLRITLQVLGFLVLLSGTSLYNELLRSCLPSPVLVSDATASLLGEEDGQGNGAGEGNGTRQRGSAAYAVRAPPIKENYSMARSMRVLPQALSPHSLSSVRFSRVFGPLAREDSGVGSSALAGRGDDEEGSLSTHMSWLTRGGDESAHGGMMFPSEDSLDTPLLLPGDAPSPPPPSRSPPPPSRSPQPPRANTRQT